jgi:hypothetical protein
MVHLAVQTLKTKHCVLSSYYTFVASSSHFIALHAITVITFWGHAVAQLFEELRAGSIPDGMTGISHWRKNSGRTMALGSTQPSTAISTKNI